MIVRVYRFNAALWATRRYEVRLQRGMAQRRGAAMRALIVDGEIVFEGGTRGA